ncbi:hypothetical protein QR674_08105 [Acinetobacter chinensis]|jgi:hypothetical protein|uniref:Zinc ribbon domain-containing protein n=1 Tax=Acinetobacter chinensis TaxID=2004650 RepID=A0ABU3WEY2_9GAMM|nr:MULTISPECIES: hypothetical protein [Acinetobacter]AXY60366.1 hypothetical protein CDG61_10210 [Acinetobacter sp. WCHAc010052]MDV2468945.1 hypothetical protein [Acinetobacter chinensis]WOE40258.1 hypothetical protein QSG87_10105 [Acinetobacter chinensis]
MLYHQYHCACCDKVVASVAKECPECGSHNIRSPYGFWIFCIVTCLVVIVIVKSVHVYLNSHQEPAHPTLLDVLNQGNQKTSR